MAEFVQQHAWSVSLEDDSIPTGDILRARIHKQLPVVKMFLDEAVTYMLSRQWHDLFAAYIFRLHPMPHCSEMVAFELLGWVIKESEVQPACSAEAAAWVQAQYALGALAVTSTLHAAAARSHMATLSPYVFEQCTAIAGMFVGWAAGDAVVRAFKDYVFAAEAEAPAPSQATEAMLLACGYTAVACAAIVLLQLTAQPLVACSNGAWVDAAEQASHSLWALATRGLTSSVAILWAYVCATILREGLTTVQPGTVLESVESRLLVLWAVCVSLFSGAFASSLLGWRDAWTDAKPVRPSAQPDPTAPAPSAPPSPPAPTDAMVLPDEDAWDDPWDEGAHQGINMEAIRAEALRSSQRSAAGAPTFDGRWREAEEGAPSPLVRKGGMGAIGQGVVADVLPGGGRWVADGGTYEGEAYLSAAGACKCSPRRPLFPTGTYEAAAMPHAASCAGAVAGARTQTARRTETARAELELANTRAELALAKARMGSGTQRSQLDEHGMPSWNEGARVFAPVATPKTELNSTSGEAHRGLEQKCKTSPPSLEWPLISSDCFTHQVPPSLERLYRYRRAPSSAQPSNRRRSSVRGSSSRMAVTAAGAVASGAAVAASRRRTSVVLSVPSLLPVRM